MELKAAWQVLPPGAPEDGFLATTAPIPPVGVEDGSLVIAGGPRNAAGWRCSGSTSCSASPTIPR